MQIIYPPSSGGYAATFPLGGGRFRADGIRPYPVLQCLLWPPAAPIQNRFFMWGATTPARHGTTSQVCHPEAERSNPRPPSPDVPSSVMANGHDTFPPQGGRFYRRRFLRPSPCKGEGGPQGRMRVRFESGLARRVVAPHKIKCKWCHGRVWEAAPHTKAVPNPMANHPISPYFQILLG